MHRALLVLCIASCGGSSSARPGNDRAGNVTVAIVDRMPSVTPGFELELSFDYRPPATTRVDGTLVSVRAACQVGAARYAEEVPAMPPSGLGVKVAGRLRAHAFLLPRLPARPTLCDLTIQDHDDYGAPDRTVLQLCVAAGGAQTAGPCAANPVLGPDVAGLSIDAVTLTAAAATDEGTIGETRPRVLMTYDVVAHRDIERSTMVTAQLDCRDAGRDAGIRECGALRAGETARGEDTVLPDQVPAPGDPCDLTFFTLRRASGEHDTIAHYCWLERRLTPGPCS